VRVVTLRGLWLFGVVLVIGCALEIDDGDPLGDDDSTTTGDDDTAGDDDATADDDSVADDDSEPIADTAEFVPMFLDVVTHLVEEETLVGGDWDGDFGDATAYAPPVLLTYGALVNNEEVVDLGRSVLERELAMIDDLTALDDMEVGEVVIGALGLVEAYAIEPDPVLADALDRLFTELIDPTITLLGYYLPSVYGPFTGYGATTITALVASLYLEYVRVVAPGDSERLEMGRRILEEIDTRAWNPAGYYQADPYDDELQLYPNVAMIHALARAHDFGLGDDLATAETCLATIEVLYLPDLSAYTSSISPSYPDQAFLSCQNYTAIALLSLFHSTGDEARPQRAVELMRFARDRLLADGIVHHHWEDGHAAPDYCTGCNFQLLFVLLQMGIAENL